MLEIFTASEQIGEPGHCTLAQVFGPDGNSVATIDATKDSNVASMLAELAALAFNAAFLPDQLTAIDRPAILREIALEHERQVEVEGFDAARDDGYRRAELAGAAACYALAAARPTAPQVKHEIEHAIREVWPWDKHWWKPTTPRRDLVKAAALIIAEIERIDRAEARQGEGGQ